MSILSDELANDPLVRGYAGMTIHQIADDLNTKNRPRNRETITGAEILDGTDWTEYTSLTAGVKSQWLAFTSAAQITANKAGLNIVRDIFGLSSATETNLLAIREETISRAEELGLGFVRPGDVQEASLLNV